MISSLVVSIRISLLVLAASLTVLPSLAHSQASPARRVIRGQEVVVSFPATGGGFSARASSKVNNLKLGRDVRLSRSMASGSLGVFSSSSTLAAHATEAIIANEQEISALCRSIRAQNPGVNLTCEANTIIETQRTPNDTQYSALYGMTKINAPAAWDISTGSSGVVVGVIDTGIDYTHPDLADNIATNSGEIRDNGVDDDNNGFIDDYYGYDFINNDSNPLDDHFHGTHCSGTIGARGDNNRGVAGVNWSVKLLSVKVLDSYGSGTIASVVSGMNYAVKRGAKILSMSLGTSSYSQTLEDAIIYAKQNGALVVAAAGNNGANADISPNYPAASAQDNMVSVAASTSSDTLAYFSNWGPTSVDLAAPGDTILSTYLGGQYAYASGTSMATPHVAGMAALLKAVNPALTYSQIKSILISTVDPISSMTGKMVSGGRANIYKAVLQAQGGTPTPTPTQAPTTPTPAPTGTVTPAPTPTTSPTPTPTPPTMETPPADENPNEISIAIERTRRKVYIFGQVLDSTDAPVSNLNVSLVCDNRGVGTRSTDTDGYYEFVFKRPSRPIRCWATEPSGGRSRRITVR